MGKSILRLNKSLLKWAIILVLVFYLVGQVGPTICFAQWADEYQISQSTDAGFATLSYAPNGDLRIFYSTTKDDNRALVVRKRVNGEENFNEEIIAHTHPTSDMRLASAYYPGGNEIYISAESVTGAHIFYSNDDGLNWEEIKFYSATNYGGEQSYLPSSITGDGSNLHLFYGYVDWSAVFGASQKTYMASRISNAWDSAGRGVDLRGSSIPRGSYKEGNNILLITSYVSVSNDNGNSFSKIGDEGSIPDRLNNIGGCARDSNGKFYIVRNYSYGVSPYDKHIKIYTSNDFGQTWNILRTVDHSENLLSPKIAVGANLIVVVWGISDSFGNIERIEAIMSRDSGQTWTVRETILIPSKVIRSTDYKDDIYLIARNGRVTLSYSLTTNGHTRDGVYLKEYFADAVDVAPPFIRGDLNNDGYVDAVDWSLMNAVWFTDDATADLNGDGIVNTIDFSLLNVNWTG